MTKRLELFVIDRYDKDLSLGCLKVTQLVPN